MAAVGVRSHANGLVKVEIDLAKLTTRLNELPDAIRGKFVRGALREALTPTLAIAQTLAPSDSGKLSANIHIRPGKSRGTRITALVSSSDRKGATRATGSTYYGYFVEKGFKHHFSGKQVPGKHYMSKAMERTENVFTARVEALLSEMLAQYFA